MNAISSYRGNRHTNTQTDRGDYNTLRRNLARSVIIMAIPNPTRTGHMIRQLGRFPNPFFERKQKATPEYRST